MEKMKEIRNKLCKELDVYSGVDLNRNDVETIHMLTDTIKNIDKIERMEDEGYSMDDGMRGTRYGYARDGYSRDGYARDGYANRGMHYVRGHYSRHDGKEKIMDVIDGMMEYESDESARQALRKAKRALNEM